MFRRRGQSGRRITRGLTAGFTGLAAAAALMAAGSAQAGVATARIGSVGPVPAGATRAGELPGSTVLRVDVVLAPRNQAALAQYAAAVSTPGSALYHHYLAQGQFPRLFGPSSASIASVLSALRASGLNPGAISANHLSVPIRATAGQFERAFGINLVRYRLANGRIGYRSTRAPTLPAAAAAHVQAVIGLDNLFSQQPLLARPAGTAAARPARAMHPAGEPTGGPQPCAAATNEAVAYNSDTGFLAYTADQLAWAYDFSPLYQAGDFGQGVTVAIVEFGEPYLPSDIGTFQNCYGTHASVSRINVDRFTRTGAGEGEAALDIETVASMAPKAKIEVFEGPNSGAGPYDVYRAIVAQDRARVVSVSYGLCEHYETTSDVSAINVLFEQAAVQGQTVVVSAGDSGSEGCLPIDGNQSRLSASFPASDPFVLSVGGTAVATLPSTSGTGPGEVVWNDAYDGDGAGGGGKSVFFAMPAYQRQFLKVSGGVREVPDVSADADPETGYVILHSNTWQVIGGTSAAAPLWAALVALADEQCPASPAGFANPAIYYAASPAVSTVVIDDIQTSSSYPNNVNNDYTGQGGGQYPVLVGYDMATGIGSPLGAPLASYMCSLSQGNEGQGYWLATASGHVYNFHAPNHGSLTRRPASPVVGIASTASGYWLVTAKGHVYAFGVPNRGSVSGRLASPVVGIAADQVTGGYWLVTAKGRVYSFHAPSRGSVSNPSSPVVGIAADPFSSGYWIATANGRVYAKGTVSFARKRLTGVTAIAADSLRQGYWLVTAGGKVYHFNAGSYGSMPLGGKLGRVVGIAADAGSGGYWLVTSTGHVGAFFAGWHGDHPGQSSRNPIVAIAGTQ